MTIDDLFNVPDILEYSGVLFLESKIVYGYARFNAATRYGVKADAAEEIDSYNSIFGSTHLVNQGLKAVPPTIWLQYI